MYTIQIWINHKMVESKTFASKAEAEEWIENNNWDLEHDLGHCYIHRSY